MSVQTEQERSAISGQASAIGGQPSATSRQPSAVGHPQSSIVDRPSSIATPLADYLAEAARRGASDLLLIADAPPTIYLCGQWRPLDETALSHEQISDCLAAILTDAERAALYEKRDLDFALTVPGAGRVRANIHYQRQTLAAAFRTVPTRVPPFDQLGLPQRVLRFADFPNGLVLVTGCTGQGKSTTLAALIDHMNHTRADHVITIEDPIEFIFDHGSCLIEQRQIGDDSPSFASALRHVLRQRPDVILIGEMRDAETIATALTAAETGHLVLASLHTSSAPQTLARIIDVFPPAQQPQVRTQLAASLRAILCQVLLPDRRNATMTPATELLIATSAVRRAVRDNETHLIYAMLETGKRQGMHTLEQSLAALVKTGRVESGDAAAAATDPVRLEKLIGRRPPAEAAASPAVPSARAERIEVPTDPNPT